MILLAIASASSLLAVGLAIAWSSSLVPLETVWGPVASWVNVGVTALGFLVAGLTFYLRFREVSQGDDEKKTQQEKEDLESTFQLHQLTDSARAAMLSEASQVTWELVCDSFLTTEELPGFTLKYQARFAIRNGTGKRLTDVHVEIPNTTTHYGDFPASRIDVPDFKAKSVHTQYAEPYFAGKMGVHILATIHGPHSRGDGPKGPVEVFSDRAILTFRVDAGPRWQLPLSKFGGSNPTLKL
ncbi:hypothetical protein ACX800_22875 [Paenarthrobacter nitroguajacolicus]|uniref:hypothetical protein n=1 Tax=Arthrobacter sp. AK01 TaxID=2894084 RepID=UPI001E2A60E3|nr:hypothetical protein [Arthrobacter sp. AK01]MCD4850766.1 hypothetical protein [Arthrobacter sp. AK01]